jgi:actin-related protein
MQIITSLDFETELQKAAATTEGNRTDIDPKNEQIVVGSERFRCPELLFKPSLKCFEFNGIHQALFDSILKCDVNVKSD